MKTPTSLNRRQFLEVTVAAVAAAPFAIHASEPPGDSPAKIQLGCVSWNFHSLGAAADPEPAIDIIGGLGFDGIELIATSGGDFKTFWTDERVDRLKQKLERNKLRVPQFAMFQPVVENLSSPRRDERERALDLFESGCRLAAKFDAPIVNIVALLQAALAWRSWAFFLYDPMTTILWVYVLATAFVWGRGTFCGWLCPFGALQELVASATRRLGLRPRRVGPALDRRLKRVKYGALAVVLAAAVVSVRWADRLVEVEPFKTAITLRFERTWGYSAYAVALVVVGAVFYKAFCRYLCPLGAFLALAGRLRRLDWIVRRAECGSPCQLCRNRCEYQAIERDGSIVYEECFQCMDCVAVYHGDDLCVPRILERKGRSLPVLRSGAHRAGGT